jgi:glycosyltransferase
MINIFIFNNASRAAGYGIGTYIRQLSEGFSAIPDTKVSFVEMYADTKEFSVNVDDSGHTHYLIPPLKSAMESEAYYRSIFYFLARDIDVRENERTVFQFNYFQHYLLAILLKAWYPQSMIVLTVHYLSWCFELNGNIRRMKEIMAEGHELSDDQEKSVESSFTSEERFMHLADAVFVLSQKTKDILIDDYKVAPEKLFLVYNGAGSRIDDQRDGNKDGFRTVLFVGRLEKDKGVKYLIEAFVRIADAHPDSKLVIVGDGDFQPYLAQSRTLSGRVAFFGKTDKDEIEDIYRSAYIGVIPSFHEQCSYTVIEMMRHGIPVIGTDRIGLAEMLDATPQLRIHINDEDFNEEDFVAQIASRMDLLLSDNAAYHSLSEAVSRQYEKCYTVEAMTGGVQNALLRILERTGNHVSVDFLPHIDNRMIALINSHPDMDLDFYGLSGIGCYLWWRVSQMEKENVANADQLALIREYLIYYLDWIGEVVENEPLPVELHKVLLDMKACSFYPTKVNNILECNKVAYDDRCLLSEQEILHNALKICTCKI